MQPVHTTSEMSDDVLMRVAPMVAVFAAGACVKQLPPAPTPAATMPTMPAGPPPAPGMGRLVVDVVDGPAPVQRTSMVPQPTTNPSGRTTYRFEPATDSLCAAAPCVTDLATGNVLLAFPVIGDPDALETELVHVGPEPSVYRRALSVYTDNTGALRVMGIIMTSFGGAALATGATLLPIGLSRDSSGLTTAGGISLGAGAALLVFGILAIRADSPTYQPGASNHFPLAPQ